MKLDVVMTSSETKTFGGLPPKIQRGTRVEQVTRKPSFKCPVPNRPSTNQRITRKVMLPMSTVQALTCKFNELSQLNQNQLKTAVKGRKGQALVKRGVNGKSSTITVVICRKPSSLKQRKQEERKRRIQEDTVDGKLVEAIEVNRSQRNVQQRVTEFEERKTNSRLPDKPNVKPNINRTSKILVPKVIVDIDLNDDKCLNKSEVPKSTSDSTQSNGWSVKTAIDKFEKNIGSVKMPLSVVNENNKKKSEEEDVQFDENENSQIKNQNIVISKRKPIATIKPILKKTEDRSYPISTLSPKDSLYRKKYVGMKRDQAKGNKENDSNNREKLTDKKVVISKEKQELDEYYPCRSIESLEKLKNKSTLFSTIPQPSAEREEKVQDEENSTPEQDAKTGNQNLKPNASFLWSRKEEAAENLSEKLNRTDMPLPLPPENYIPDIADDHKCFLETIYDDVQPKASEDFDKSSNHSDDTVYDDIGVYNKSSEGYEKINGMDDNEKISERTMQEVMKKNFLNNMVNGQVSDSLYCISKNLVYNYDDGESERYYYIRHKNATDSPAESYQYIQNDDGNNIYEDIQSVRNRLLTKQNNKEMYENMPENESNNCYESVYERFSSAEANQPYIRSSSSEASSTCRSTYEKSNSLYGMATVSGSSSDHRTNSTEVSETEDPDVYHASPFARPSSESSQSNSDEWVEVSDTESEQTVYLVKERPRKTKSGASGWAQKERRRWLKMQKKADAISGARDPNFRLSHQDTRNNGNLGDLPKYQRAGLTPQQTSSPSNFLGPPNG